MNISEFVREEEEREAEAIYPKLFFDSEKQYYDPKRDVYGVGGAELSAATLRNRSDEAKPPQSCGCVEGWYCDQHRPFTLASGAQPPQVDFTAVNYWRVRAQKAEQEIEDWKAGLMADYTGHMLRCVKVNGVWKCKEGCAVARAEKAERKIVVELRIRGCDE